MVENRLATVGVEDRVLVPATNGRQASARLPGENHTPADKPSPSLNGANGGKTALSSSAQPATGAGEPTAHAPAGEAARGPGGR